MKLEFTEKFKQDVKKINDLKTKEKIIKIIDECASSNTLTKISNIKKLKGYDKHYRIKFGNYRIGLSYNHGVIIFSRCMHRKDIYRYFPE